MKKILTVAFLSMLFASTALAAGSCNYTTIAGDPKTIIHQWVCLSDSSGNVSSPTITAIGNDSNLLPLYGFIFEARIKPGASTLAPTASYVVKLNPVGDATVDLLNGLGAANSATVTTVGSTVDANVGGLPARIMGDVVQPFASGVGDANQFTLTICIEKVN